MNYTEIDYQKPVAQITFPSRAADMLARARDLILEDGWHQNSFENLDTGAVCAIGALRCQGTWATAYFDAITLLEECIPADRQHLGAAQYNDSLPFTVDGLAEVADWFTDALELALELDMA
jgi:hypothetical protein